MTYIDPRASKPTIDIFNWRLIWAFHTNVAGSAGKTQSTKTFRNDATYVVMVAKVVALQVPSGGFGAYPVHSYSTGWQLNTAIKKKIILKMVTAARKVQMVILRQRWFGQIRKRKSPTIHLVRVEITM